MVTTVRDDRVAEPKNPPSTASFLTNARPLSPVGSNDFIYNPDDWRARRDGGLAPRYSGPLADNDDHRRHFVRGAMHSGIDPADLKPQQLRIVDALTDRDLNEFVIEAPRRASKSSSIFMYLHGVMLAEPGTRVAFMAGESATAARRLYKQWIDKLNLATPPGPGEDPKKRSFFEDTPRRPRRSSSGTPLAGLDLPDYLDGPAPATPQAALRDRDGKRGYITMAGAGAERIEYVNGSRFIVLKPDADAIIGQEFDVVWIDEAQGLDPDTGADLIDRALPTMDTKPWPRFILSGTTGKTKKGPFWTWLARLRAADDAMGGVDWAADPLTSIEDIEDEDRAIAILETMHPGIGTLTTLERMRKVWRSASDRPRWAREYLSLWPEHAGEVIIAPDVWAPLGLTAAPHRPAPGRLALGFKVQHGGGAAAVTVAWRSATGHAHVQVLAHRLGTKWLGKYVADLARKYRAPVGYDATPEAAATAAEITREFPHVDLVRLGWQDMNAGCVQLAREIDRGTLRHQNQAELTVAALQAGKRIVRGNAHAWLFDYPADIDGSPLDSGVVALRTFDKQLAPRVAAASAPRRSVIVLQGAA